MNFLLRRFIRPPAMRNYNPMFLFSVSKDPFTEKHEAILAFKIISKIIESSKQMQKQIKSINKHQDQNSFYTSLRSEIIGMINGYENKEKNHSSKNQPNQHQASVQTAKRNILDFFDGGVWVDKQLCVQERFLSEAFNERKLKMERKKISFCPTYAVTAPIFKLIYKIDQTTLVTGHYGIGKTYSFLLYHLLSDIVYRYLHKYDKQKQRKINGMEVNFPKLVYWSIDKSLFKGQFNQKEINELIAKQCYQLTDHHPNYIFIHQKENQQLNARRYFQKNDIYIKIVIDQIQLVASKFRMYQNKVQARKSLEWKNRCMEDRIEQLKDQKQISKLNEKIEKNKQQIKEIKQKQQELKQQFKRAQKILEIAQTLKRRFETAFFLSSKTIQRSQMVNLDLNGQGSHTLMGGIQIPYTQYKQTNQLYSDLAELFEMLLEIRYQQIYELELTQTQKDFVHEIKDIFFEKLRERNSFIFPLAIRYIVFEHQQNPIPECTKIIEQVLKSQQLKTLSNETNNEKKKIFNKQRIQEKIDEILNLIEKKSKQEIKALVIKFLKKHEGGDAQKSLLQKQIFLFKLLYAGKSIILQKEKNPQVALKQISIPDSEIFSNNTKPSQSQIQKNIDQNLAYYRYDGKIILTVSQEILIEVLRENQTSLLQALHESYVNIYNLIRGDSLRGSYFESLLVKSLSLEGTKLNIKTLGRQNLEIVQQFPAITSDSVLKFHSIPIVTSNHYCEYRFLKPFSETFKKQSTGFFLHMPIKQKFNSSPSQLIQTLQQTLKYDETRTQQQTVKYDETITQQKTEKYDETSKKMDFALTQLAQNQAIIRVFDATTSKKGQDLQKLSDFLYEFTNFVDRQQQVIKGFKNQLDAELHYYVIVPKVKYPEVDWRLIIDKTKNKLQKDLKNENEKSQDLKKEIQKLQDFLNQKKKQDEIQKQTEFGQIKVLSKKKESKQMKQLKKKKEKKEQMLEKINKRIKNFQDRIQFFLKLFETQGKNNFQDQNKQKGKKTDEILTYKNVIMNKRQLKIKRSNNLQSLLTQMSLVQYEEIENKDNQKVALHKALLQKVKKQESK